MRLDNKTRLIILLSIVIVVLSLLRSCSDKRYEKRIADLEDNCEKNPRVVTRIDSIPYKDTSHTYKPQVASISKKKYGFADWMNEPDTAGWFSPPVLHDTLFYLIPADTANILADYFVTKYYRDSLQSDFGTVTVIDSVSQNRIFSRSAIWNLNIPRETRVETITKRKGVLYFGVDAIGNKYGINGVGGNIMYSSPKALNYEIGAMLSDNHAGVIYKAGIKIPMTKK